MCPELAVGEAFKAKGRKVFTTPNPFWLRSTSGRFLNWSRVRLAARVNLSEVTISDFDRFRKRIATTSRQCARRWRTPESSSMSKGGQRLPALKVLAAYLPTIECGARSPTEEVFIPNYILDVPRLKMSTESRQAGTKISDAVGLTPDVLASSVALVSEWLSENRDWIEAGGSGDLDCLVRDLANHLRQRCGSPQLQIPNGIEPPPTHG